MITRKRFRNCSMTASRSSKFVITALIGALALTATALWVAANHGNRATEAEYQPIDVREIGQFAFDDTNGTELDVPVALRKLDGQKVVVTAEMFSDTSESKSDHFQLAWITGRTGFQGPPRVQQRIFARSLAGRKFPIYAGTVRVFGILHIKVEHDKQWNNRISSLYTMDVDRIEPE